MKRRIVILTTALILFSARTIHAETIRVPKEVVKNSVELGEKYYICPELIQAMCFKESSFNENAKNNDCIGIMQIDPKWHADRIEYLGVQDLNDIKQNMSVGVDYLAEILKNTGDISEALMIYNGDSDADKANNGYISSYASDILSISENLERENGK